MKTQFNLVAIIMVTIATTCSLHAATGWETDKMIIRVEQEDGESIRIQLANLEKKHTTVSITGVDGKTWFWEKARGVHGFAKKLQLKDMPTGEYVLQIKNRDSYYVQVFIKSNSKVIFFNRGSLGKREQAVAMRTSRPSVKESMLISRIKVKDEHKVDIQLANLQHAPSELILKSIEGSTMYQTRINQKHGFAKTMNLEDLMSGQYYFLFRTGKMILVQFFTIDDDGVVLGEKQQLSHVYLDDKVVTK